MDYANKLPGFGGLIYSPYQSGGERVKITGERSLEMSKLPGFSNLKVDNNKVKEDSDAIEFIEKEIRQESF